MNNVKHIPYFSLLLTGYFVWFLFSLVIFLESQASFAYLSPIEVVTTLASAILLPLIFVVAWITIAIPAITTDNELQTFQLVDPNDAYRAAVNANHAQWVDAALAQILWKLNEAPQRKTRAHRRPRKRRANKK